MARHVKLQSGAFVMYILHSGSTLAIHYSHSCSRCASFGVERVEIPMDSDVFFSFTGNGGISFAIAG